MFQEGEHVSSFAKYIYRPYIYHPVREGLCMRGRLGNNSDCPYTNTYETHTHTRMKRSHAFIILKTRIHICEMLASPVRNAFIIQMLKVPTRIHTTENSHPHR